MKSIRATSKLAAAMLVALLAGGCAGTMRDYDSELKQTVGMASSGNIDQALQELEKNNSDANKDLLYYMEKGELLRLKNQLPESRDAWLLADEKVKIWEEEAKTTPEKLIGNIGSVLINDKTRRYDGQDYEKVMLSTRLALDHLALWNWDAARTEIKKTHEREAIIAELRAKEVANVEEDAKQRKVKTEVKDLKGYPVETLDDPEVIALKNGYQSAFSHYLAGFVYETLNEPSLAAPGYRKAIELRPDVKWLEEGLKGLETRARKLKPNESDVLFVVEVGSAPARSSVSIPIPVPYKSTWGAVPISFPVIKSDKSVFLPTQLNVGGKNAIPVHPVTNIDAMARRALKDDMPGIVLRGTIRAITKTVAQKQAADRDGLLGILVTIAAVVTESADERVWRTLPSHILVGRATLPWGNHTIGISGPFGTKNITAEVAGRHTLVALRLMGSSLYAATPQYPPQLLAAAEAVDAESAVAVTANEAPKAQVKKKAFKPKIKPEPTKGVPQ
ncbi:MAG: hypothetical protein KKH74_03875 [Gammaproteobacteria bacterium]|nr:hypothetical protein [Gammaproteobacteria bacterium]MBU1733134.1 hypothetical protein [Gammaproteobacteria bacterium]MBU1892182.1 hypothetical protein [Gammaproteobacteria bacterium]